MNNADLKSHCLLWTILARNQRYQQFVDDRDIDTVVERCEQEGLSFLTIALPRIGKAIDNFHATTVWSLPLGFKPARKEVVIPIPGHDGNVMHVLGSVPVFLNRAICLALKGDTLAVDCVRQLSYAFYKLEVPYDKVLLEDFFDRFKQTDRDLPRGTALLESKETKELVQGMRKLIFRILCNADPLDIFPNHASGKTACRTKNQDKWHELRYYPKLDAVYPYSDYFFFSATHLSDELGRLEQSETKDPRARVVPVPKDSRGPRVISCEPAELMYIQKGQQELLYRHLETHKITRGCVNFTHQSVNRLCAMLGSRHGSYATIDLKDASDRVSLDLVRLVFPPRWVEALEASRSEETVLPSGEIVKLNKFAPMGSACCFPVEALIFFACAWVKQRSLGVKRPEVFVYGDDIIVPTAYAGATMESLESVGFIVNREKSFWQGPFRESCGGEYHNGYDITPIRFKKPLTKSHTNIVVAADLCNNIIAKFGYHNAQELVSYFETLLGYVFPRTLLSLPGTIRSLPCSSNDAFLRRRFNKALQRYEYRILKPTTRTSVLRQPAWCELMRTELASGSKTRVTMEPPAENESQDHHRKWHLDDRILSGRLLPGEYTLDQDVRTSWSWTWLG